MYAQKMQVNRQKQTPKEDFPSAATNTQAENPKHKQTTKDCGVLMA